MPAADSVTLGFWLKRLKHGPKTLLIGTTMNMNKQLLIPLLCAAFGIYSGNALAFCVGGWYGDGADMYEQLPDLVVARDTPPGTVLYTFESTVMEVNQKVATCAGTVPASLSWNSSHFPFTFNGETLYSLRPTNPNSGPGVGLRILLTPDFSTGAFPRSRTRGSTSLDLIAMEWGKIKFEIVRTAGVINDGPLNTIGQLTAANPDPSGGNIGVFKSISLRPGSIKSQSCSVAVPAPVDLGTVDQRKFPGPGMPYPKETLFDLQLSGCDSKNMQINLRLDGTTDTQPDVLALSRANSGVGIQVLDKNTGIPITFNQDMKIGDTGGATNVTIPLAARYFQVGPQIINGAARANAQFTVTYK